MNSNAGKLVIYFLTIGLIAFFLIYFYKTLAVEDISEDFVEVKTRTTKTNIREDIDLKLLGDEKFIDLRKRSADKAVFQAGKRNPFEPYDHE